MEVKSVMAQACMCGSLSFSFFLFQQRFQSFWKFDWATKEKEKTQQHALIRIRCLFFDLFSFSFYYLLLLLLWLLLLLFLWQFFLLFRYRCSRRAICSWKKK